jgi:hypothetical protein
MRTSGYETIATGSQNTTSKSKQERKKKKPNNIIPPNAPTQPPPQRSSISISYMRKTNESSSGLRKNPEMTLEQRDASRLFSEK